jgi:hypothetical protein
MLRQIKQDRDYLCESVGKLCLISAFAFSAFVVVHTILNKDTTQDYQERLRKAYSGLSPEEY